MTVVELRQRTQLLTDSVQAMRNSYGRANNDVSQDELNEDDEWEWN